MTITLDSIQSSSISSTTFLLVTLPVALVIFVVFGIIAARQSDEFGGLSVGSCMGYATVTSLIVAIFSFGMLGTYQSEHERSNLVASVRSITGGTLSGFQNESIPTNANSSGAVLFTPEGETPRTCTLSTDDVKFTLVCPTSDVVETILN